jgi:transcriptional regulator with XRE-family HTH domain
MVTIADVARRAGVSTSTVSYVLNGRTSVSDATRRRVQRSVAELGYHPNAGAKALAGRRHACDVLLITSDEGPEGVRRVAASGLADGVILMAVELETSAPRYGGSRARRPRSSVCPTIRANCPA